MTDDAFYEDDKPKKKKADPDVLVIRNIMRTADGRTWAFKKLQSWSVFETIFSSDPVKHGFNAGLREAGVQLNRELQEAAPAEYVKMIEENI